MKQNVPGLKVSLKTGFIIHMQIYILKVVNFEEKGRGVVSSHFIPRGAYVCEYSGRLLTKEEALLKEKEYENDETVGCYMYYFMYKGEKYW